MNCGSKFWEEAHAKNPNDYEYARIILYAPDKSNLHEMTLTYINTLNYNGAWDFEIEHIEKEHTNIVTFKYNGTITALNAFSKLHFDFENTVKWEFVESLL